MKMDNFEKKEQLAKETFDNFCKQEKKWCKVTRFTPGKYDPYDVVYQDNKERTIGEIKFRKNKVTDYDDWYLEKDKYDKLIEIKENAKKELKVTYINHFLDNTTYIWDLTEINMLELELVQRKMQKDDSSDEMVWKWVFLLPRSLARKYVTDDTKGLFTITEYNID